MPDGKHDMKEPVRVHVTTPKLTALRATTSATIKVAKVDSEVLELEVTTSGTITIGGKCKKLEATAASSGKLDAGGLACEDVKVEATTSGDMTVNASSSVTGNAATSGRVHVQGSPKDKKVTTETSGAVD